LQLARGQAVPYQNITLSDLDILLQSRFDNPGFWSSGERRDALNEGLSIFQLATGRWRKRFTVTTVAKRVFYNIPTLSQLQIGGICQALQAIRVSFNGPTPLGWSSFYDMDCAYPGWQAQTTATPGSPATPQMCGPAGVNWLWIWPADAVGNNSLLFDLVLNAPKLVNAGEFVNLDTTEITGLLDYAQHKMSFKRGGIFFARTIPLYQGFLRMMADRNSYLMNIDIFRRETGADFARNFAPRRASERSGRPLGIGVR
jgi:hypothetical protein